jgi:hypothetical protein
VNDRVTVAVELSPAYRSMAPGSTTNRPRLSSNPKSLRSTVRVVLVGTHRLDEARAHPRLRSLVRSLQPLGLAEEMTLTPLSADAVATFAAAILEGPKAADDLAHVAVIGTAAAAQHGSPRAPGAQNFLDRVRESPPRSDSRSNPAHRLAMSGSVSKFPLAGRRSAAPVEADWRAVGVVVEPDALAEQGCVPRADPQPALRSDRLGRVGEPIPKSVGSRGSGSSYRQTSRAKKETPMTYIDNICPSPRHRPHRRAVRLGREAVAHPPRRQADAGRRQLAG